MWLVTNILGTKLLVEHIYMYLYRTCQEILTVINVERVKAMIKQYILLYNSPLLKFKSSSFPSLAWPTAMCEIVMPNKRLHNMGYYYFRLRHDVITWTKKPYLTL